MSSLGGLNTDETRAVDLKNGVDGPRELTTIPQSTLRELLHALSNLSRVFNLEVDIGYEDITGDYVET